MTKIYESPFCGWDERAEAIAVYELDEGEYEKISEEYYDENYCRDYERLLADMGLHSEDGCVMPGALYTRYYVESLTVHHLVISRVDALNV